MNAQTPSCSISPARAKYADGSFPDPLQDLNVAEKEWEITLAGGCFWCVEAVFLQLDGVIAATSGYVGGSEENANYKAVCSGHTGHAEAVKIRFDTARLSWASLLKVFFSVAHDPTQKNRQGADVGTQYRSAVFYNNADEKAVTQAYIDQLNEAQVFSNPIATTLEPLDHFFPAEDYHQNYAALNPRQPYIQGVSQPKVDKLRQRYAGELK